MSKIKDFLHPLWRTSLSSYGNKENIDFLGAIQKPLDQTEQDILEGKLQLYLTTATGHWLDYWAKWLGLRRIKNEADTVFKARLLSHVKHSRNTVKAIRKAVADFIKTNEDNVMIYEPFRDMAYWNSAYFNTLKYFPSSYYNYAIIDVHIDASFPTEVVEILNLFRPAGVIWVITDDINGVNPDIEPIDFVLDSSRTITDEFWEYAGFKARETNRIVASLNDNDAVGNYANYNDGSDWNSSKVYYKGDNKFDTVVTVGQLYEDYVPLATDYYTDTRPYSDQRTIEENSILSNYNTSGVAFNLQPNKSNLLGNSSVGTNLLTGTSSEVQYYTLKKDSETQGINETPNRDHLATQFLTVGETYTYRAKISNTGYTGTIQVAIWDSSSHLLKTFYGNNISKGEWEYSSVTFEVPENAYWFNFSAIFSSDTIPANTPDLFAWKEEKLELGTVATDWIPNSADGTLITNYSGTLSAINKSNYFTINSLNANASYQVGLKGKSSLASSNNKIIVTLNNNNGDAIDFTLTSSTKSNATWYESIVETPEEFSSTGTGSVSISSTDSSYDFDFDYLTIREYNDLSPLAFSFKSTDNYSKQGLTTIIDVKQYLMRFTSYTTSNLSPTYIDSSFSKKDFVITAKIVPETLTQPVDLYLYNFNLSMWVKVNTISLSSAYTSLITNINDIAVYLNSNCLLFAKLIPEATSNILPISINYVGLTLGNDDIAVSSMLSQEQDTIEISSEPTDPTNVTAAPTDSGATIEAS